MNQSNEDLHVYLRQIRPGEITSLSMLSAMVPRGAQVLDLGCGSGALGKNLTETRGCSCDGVTLSQVEADHALPHYRRIEVADLETAQLSQLFAGQKYDAIVCADVLEHLRRPERVLDECMRLLSPAGRLLISVPNAAYAGLTLELMHGEFRYRPEGLLDRTHLRFFTRNSLTRFLQEHGWQIDHLQTIARDLSDSEFETTPDSLPPSLARYLLAQPDALTYQFVGVVSPASGLPAALPATYTGAPAKAIFTAQLYWGDQGHYDEERKLTAAGVIGEPRQILRFSLPILSAVAPRLRLDLADRPGFLHLHSLRLLDSSGRDQWRWHAATVETTLRGQPQQQISWGPELATAPGTVLLLLTGDDPWIELPIPAAALARCMRSPGSCLEVELGWPMSADYLALAANTRALQAQNQHTDNALARLQHEHRQAISEIQRLHTMMQEYGHLQAHTHHVSQELSDLQAYLQALQRSRAFRASQSVSQLKRKLTTLLRHSPPGPQAPQVDTHPVAVAPELEVLEPLTPSQLPAQTQTPENTPASSAFAASTVVDIIIPVYQGLQETQRCLMSVLDNTQPATTRVIVINDASPDAVLAQWLRNQATQNSRVILLENETNVGFVETVNKGMSLEPANDVLLLNSDTEVAGNWVERLRAAAYHNPDIATATPLSNNATICSYPRWCESNELPAGYDTAGMDALCAEINLGITVDIPTAVGFCMYIRRDSLEQAGLFDTDHFGKGYGEENDFCMRTAKTGWRHVLALDTFVRHTGGVSFGDAKTAREIAAQTILRELHPEYESLVQAHLAADPARPYRDALDIARIQRSALPKILVVVHSIGGGTHRHVHELSDHFRGQAIFMILNPLADHRIRVTWDDPREAFYRDYSWLDQTGEVIEFLRNLGVGHLHYHHLLGVNPGLMLLAEHLGVGYDFTAHDYYTACPQIAMVDANNSYCGEQDVAHCTACLHGRPSPTGESIEDWRLRHRLFLNGARNVLAPSRDTAKRLLRYFPAANIRHAPHLDLTLDLALVQPNPRTVHSAGNLRVFVIGAVSRIKGGETLEAISLDAARMQAPIEFHLLGYPHLPLRQQPHASLTVHGAYQDADLQLLLERLQPDLIWFPARWPETYSYTLSAALEAGLPILAPNLGAFPERLAGRAWSWIYPWNTPPGECLELLLNLRERHYVNAVVPRPAPQESFALPDDALPPWSYNIDYLAKLTKA